MGSTSQDRPGRLSRPQPLLEATGVNVPFGTMIGWRTPAGKEYGVVVGSDGNHLLALTAYDKRLAKDKGLKYYRDEALSGKLAPFMPSVQVDLQRVPANRAFKHGRMTGAALLPFQAAAKHLQLEGTDSMSTTKHNVFVSAAPLLHDLSEQLDADLDSDITEEEMEEGSKAVVRWVKEKYGAAKAAAHRAFIQMVRKDPAAHRRKMREDRKYHQRHKWHDALMRKTSRPGWVRKHMRSHVEIPDDLMSMDERDPGQSFMDLPFELRVTEQGPCPECGCKRRAGPDGKCPKCGAMMAEAQQARPDSMKVQTLIFSKKKFSKKAAMKWAALHGFASSKVDEKENTFRLRQKDPGQFETFRTITFKPGIKAVVAKI